MFYISLPYFYENYKFNNFFNNYVDNSNKNQKEFKLVDNFTVEYVYGAFPWSLWNGGVNSHVGKAVLSQEIEQIINAINTPIRFDASNILLKEEDYLDIHENAILKISNGSNNIYEISNFNLMDYISKMYLNNKFIISNNLQITTDLNEDLINTLINNDNIDLINLGYHLIYDISKINNKDKIECMIGYCYNCSNKQNLICNFQEQQNIYNFSGNSLFINCSSCNKNVDYYQQILPMYHKGIKHFKIMTSVSNLDDFNINIIKSFIKPEFQGECISEYYRAIAK